MKESTSEVPARELIRAGLQDLDAARHCLSRLCRCHVGDAGIAAVLDALKGACDPDAALRGLVDVVQSRHECGIAGGGSDGDGQLSALMQLIEDGPAIRRLIRVLGASEAMGRLMYARPRLVEAAAYDACGSANWERQERVSHMLKTVGTVQNNGAPVSSLPLTQAVSALRCSYYHQLAAIMAFDLGTDNPTEIQPQVSVKLSDLADATLEAALAIARHEVEGSERCRLAIIAMGKLGAQELNYVSDVDLMYVVEPIECESSAAPLGTTDLTRVGTQLVKCVQQVCQGSVAGVAEPAIWQIDTALRPEGKDGVLVRRLESYCGYYEKWAKNWEFQALLKARAAAGDMNLGRSFVDMTQPMVWQALKRKNFVYDCQKMRTRVEENIEPALRDREIKLGRGGLRDVEFTVQMLQLVHGRTDETLRQRSTLEALSALAEGGYVSRKQAARLSEDYRFERVMEHRQQMWQLKRTHLFPDVGNADGFGGHGSRRQASAEQILGNADLRRLGRAFGLLPDQLLHRFDDVRREVRRLHVDIYYRPMLPISAQLSDDQVNLDGKAVRERFASIGFQDPESAMRHVQALTQGVSRAAKINRILLPVVLGWLSEGQNPDMGLLGWRKLEERFGDGSPYLGFLRDSTQAAKRLCHVLSNSRLLSDALCKSVESVTWLGDDAKLQPQGRASLDTRCKAAEARYGAVDQIQEFATSIRAMRRREIERIGLAWMSGVIDDDACLAAMTDVYDAMIDSALRWSMNRQVREHGVDAAPASIAIIAMGRYGGREVNFCSDADVIALYRPVGGVAGNDGPVDLAAFANNVIADMRRILEGPLSTELGIELDFGLRPEGKNGPLIRSYDSCRTYYTSWYSTWERQALLRARFAAGDRSLGQDFLRELADPLRYPENPLNNSAVGEIRKLKARMEAERLPRGVSRTNHVKLGAGGLSDVEWTVQLLQLQHAGANVKLRTTSTLAALDELEHSGVVSREDAAALRKAWCMCTATRNGNYLHSGRAAQADIIPADHNRLGAVATFLGYGAHRGQHFENDLRSAMRCCRAVTQRLFYGL